MSIDPYTLAKIPKDIRFRIFHLTLFFYALFLILGNFFRLLPVSLFINNLLISEVVVYFFGGLSIVFFKNKLNGLIKVFFFSILIALSNLYGTYLQGWDIYASLYAFRLICMIFSGYILGCIIFYKYRMSLLRCMEFFVKCYAFNAALGFLIFFLFPHSWAFWVYLMEHGITYYGDPHIGRFVSPYFDPNYFAAIACIFFLFSLILKQQTEKKKTHMFFSFFFFLSILFTWSRSGIATLLLLFLIFQIQKLLPIKKWKISKEHLAVMIVFFSAILTLIFIYRLEFLHFFKRIIYLNQDESTNYRLITFQYVWKIFTDTPLFGVGYNFLSKSTKELTYLYSADSSLLSTLINFGIVPTLFFLLIFIIWSINQWKKVNSIKKQFPVLEQVFKMLHIYLIIMIFFTSQFNNCLYYVFWFIPMVALFVYLDFCIKQAKVTGSGSE